MGWPRAFWCGCQKIDGEVNGKSARNFDQMIDDACGHHNGGPLSLHVEFQRRNARAHIQNTHERLHWFGRVDFYLRPAKPFDNGVVCLFVFNRINGGFERLFVARRCASERSEVRQ